jgi:hypothetical protein
MYNIDTSSSDESNLNNKYENSSILLNDNNSIWKVENLNTFLRIIEVYIEFIQIGEVDTMNEKFQAIVKIKSKWIENENIKDYDPKEYWNPKLFIENALHVILYNLYI